MADQALLCEQGKTVLYDTVNSYYAGIARVALVENNIDFMSHYINMQAGEQTQPWYIRMHPAGMVPCLKKPSGEPVPESRAIVTYAYGSPETKDETEVLNMLYSQDPGSLAWLIGAKQLFILTIMSKSNVAGKIAKKKFATYIKENPDLKEAYEKKAAALSVKHFSKKLEDVQTDLQNVVNWLEAKRKATVDASGGSTSVWLLGPDHCRADALTMAFLQWISRCNEWSAAPVNIPSGLQSYFERTKARPSFEKAIGQYGEDGFVLTMMKKKNRIACAVLILVVSAFVGIGIHVLKK